jgi:hypothetical protein
MHIIDIYISVLNKYILDHHHGTKMPVYDHAYFNLNCTCQILGQNNFERHRKRYYACVGGLVVDDGLDGVGGWCVGWVGMYVGRSF